MGISVFKPPKNIGYGSLRGDLWVNLLKIYVLTENVRESIDPEFAQILNRIREIIQKDDHDREINL